MSGFLKTCLGAAATAGIIVLLFANGMSGASAQQAGPAYPTIRVPNLTPTSPVTAMPTGQEAVGILTPQLDAVSAWYGVPSADLLAGFAPKSPQALVSDKGDWRLDNEGRIVVREYFYPSVFPVYPTGYRSNTPAVSSDTGSPNVPAVPIGTQPANSFPIAANPSAATVAPVDMSLFQLRDAIENMLRGTDVFTRHSNPGAKVKIWLSFTEPGKTPKPLTQFSFKEKALIYQIWFRVQEDFAPFDVDVTTEKPAAGDLQRSGPGDDRYGVTVSIYQGGTDASAVQGTVYLNSFDDVQDRRRSITLAYGAGMSNPSIIAHAASHMLGHSLGLLDETTGTGPLRSAYKGHAIPKEREFFTTSEFWAPIMGLPGNAEITQFSRGEFNQATSRTDSFERISKILPISKDDVGDLPQNAIGLKPTDYFVTPLGTMLISRATGLIERQDDRDVYRVNAEPGILDASAFTVFSGSDNVREATNLVPKITLLDDSGKELASDSPQFAPSSNVQFKIVRRGTYYIVASNAGIADPLTNGFSSYGSRGHYGLLVYHYPHNGSPPVPVLTATPESGQAQLAVNFDASASRDNGLVRFTYWDFGDGNTDATGTNRKPTHVYKTPGSYQAAVRVVDNEGLSAWGIKTITVTGSGPGPVNAAPVARLTASALSGTAPLNVVFDASGSTDDGGAANLTYSWTINDEPAPSLTGTKPGQLFLSGGTYRVKVTVTDSGGRSDSALQTVVVTGNAKPVAKLTASSNSGKAPLWVSFDASGSTDDGGASVLSYSWTIDDKAEPSLVGAKPVAYRFLHGGTYRVKVTVTDAGGLSDSATQVIVIAGNAQPVARLTALPLTGTAPLTVAFDASGSTDDGGPGMLSYSWTIDDKAVPSLTGAKPAYTFQTPGTYRVKVTVSDILGLVDSGSLSDSASVTIVVAGNAKPVARLTASALAGTAPMEVKLDASGSTDDGGASKLSYSWTIDGKAAPGLTGATPTTIFQNPGTYRVEVTVSDAGGLSHSASVTIVASANARPVARLTASTLTGAAGLTVRFDASGSTDDGGASKLAYSWKINDRAAPDLAGPTPSRTFQSPGTYRVEVTVSDTSGLSHSASVDIVVTGNARPAARLTVSALSGPAPLTVRFDASGSTGSGGPSGLTYVWTINDKPAPGLSGAKTSNVFDKQGIYLVKVTVRDSGGQSGSFTQPILVTANARPVARLTASRLTGKAPMTVELDASRSTDDGGASNLTYSWAIDGRPAPGLTGAKASHRFLTAGPHSVSVTVRDAGGLTHSVTLPFTVTASQDDNAAPTARLTASRAAGSAPLIVDLDASGSTDDGGALNLSYSWAIDGKTAPGLTGARLTHVFQTAGPHTIRVTVTDKKGASDSITLPFAVTIAPRPVSD